MNWRNIYMEILDKSQLKRLKYLKIEKKRNRENREKFIIFEDLKRMYLM